ncbi:hypothetical protein TNCV_4533241 [Trichonephila clavipes]|nr:hypothetical protein TNCV_4533241 [Trichonephila clavipes]
MSLKQSDKVWNGSQKIHHKPKNKKNSIQNQTILMAFFDARGIIHKEFVPIGQTVIGQYYLAVLKLLMAKIRPIRPEYRTENSWCLIHDNALCCDDIDLSLNFPCIITMT